MIFGYTVLLFISHISSKGCCEEKLLRKLSDLQSSTPLHYRAVDGEMFRMPCKTWFRVEGSEKEINHYDQFKAEAKHSGNYTCLISGGRRSLQLQVVNKTTGCSNAEENRVTLFIDAGGHIPCPGHNCSHDTPIVWYKGSKLMSNIRREWKITNGQLYLYTVTQFDNNVFFCDRELMEGGVKWTFRRSVNVRAIRPDKYPPRILYPVHNMAQEVELGMSHSLICEVYFPEADPPGDVLWFMNYNGHLVNMTMEKLKPVKVDWELQVIGRAIIKQVTALDLNRTYTCVARNIAGNNNVTVSLKLKNKVKWLSLVEYSVGPLLFVAGLVIILHVKWLEIQMIYRSRWRLSKPHGGEKDFDVFLSYVWSTSSVSLSSPVRQEHSDAAFPFTLDPLKVEIPSQKLELLLPHVLEDQWGYRLCLMERDFIPGGAYTNDVANALQRSQMLICLLSTEYLSDNNAVFVLESGIQALLQNSAIKLLLIWSNKAPTSFLHLDPPLPTVVKKALKVLPTLKWTTGKSSTNNHFWRSLRKNLPSHRVGSFLPLRN